MEEPTTVYCCALCQTYFETYIKATLHLGLRHSDYLKSALCSRKGPTSTITRSRVSKKCEPTHQQEVKRSGLLIETKEFPQLTINLERISTTNKSTPRPSQISKSNPGKRRLAAKNEIKLDNLKASEIETLIQDLFRDQTHSKSNTVPQSVTSSTNNLSQNDDQVPIKSRKGSRKRQPKFTVRKAGIYASTSTDNEFVFDIDAPEEIDVDPVDDDFEINDSEDDDADIVYTSRSKTNSKLTSRKRYFHCRLCPKLDKFTNHKKYLKHMSTTHLKSRKDGYVCPIHKTGYFPIHLFNQHMDGHNRKSSEAKVKAKEVREASRDFKCSVELCNKAFTTEELLLSHKKFHEKSSNSKKLFKCPVCHHTFSNRHNLKRHFVMHLENCPFLCKFPGCGKKCNSAYNLRRHAVLHVNRQVYKCLHCPASYTREQRRTAHIQKYHTGSVGKLKLYACRTMPYRVKSVESSDAAKDLSDLTELTLPPPPSKTQQDSVTGWKQLKQELEDFDSDRSNTESVHLTDKILISAGTENNDIHIKGEKLSPEKSEKSLGVKSTTTSTSTTPFFNQDVFLSDPIMKKIQKTNPEGLKSILFSTYRTDSSLKFKCKLCSYISCRAFMLQQHMEKHHDSNLIQSIQEPSENSNSIGLSLICGTCGYHSTSSTDLSAHISRSHEMKKKFRCTFPSCCHRFVSLFKLKDHERRVHCTERRFSCTVANCSSKFTKESDLKRHHEKVHDPSYKNIAKEKYKCEICSKVLSCSDRLEKHRLLHEDPGALLVSCKLCNQSCAGKASLKRHIRYVHLREKNPFNEKKRLKRLGLLEEGVNSETSTLETENSSNETEATEILGF